MRLTYLLTRSYKNDQKSRNILDCMSHHRVTRPKRLHRSFTTAHLSQTHHCKHFFGLTLLHNRARNIPFKHEKHSLSLSRRFPRRAVPVSHPSFPKLKPTWAQSAHASGPAVAFPSTTSHPFSTACTTPPHTPSSNPVASPPAHQIPVSRPTATLA